MLNGWHEFYGLLGTAAAALAAALFFFNHSSIGPPLLAGALILLLLVNIRNAWNLTVFFARRRAEGDSSANSNRP
jgi:hypothetical protein